MSTSLCRCQKICLTWHFGLSLYTQLCGLGFCLSHTYAVRILYIHSTVGKSLEVPIISLLFTWLPRTAGQTLKLNSIKGCGRAATDMCWTAPLTCLLAFQRPCRRCVSCISVCFNGHGARWVMCICRRGDIVNDSWTWLVVSSCYPDKWWRCNILVFIVVFVTDI